MDFATPFKMFNGRLCDRSLNELAPASGFLSLDAGDVETELLKLLESSVDFVRIELDELKMADAEGNLLASEQLKRFDKALSLCEEKALPVGLTLSSKWTFDYVMPERMTEFDSIRSEMRRFEVYFTAIFRRKNVYDGKRLYERRCVAALEPLKNLDNLSENAAWWFCFLISPFIDHCFAGGVLKVRFDKPFPAPLEKPFAHWGYAVFAPARKASEKLRFTSSVPGIREASFSCFIREAGENAWSRLGAGIATSEAEEPHRNGGLEGFVGFDMASAVELRFELPFKIKSAKFRPSLKKRIEVEVDGATATLRLDEPRYGVLELNYAEPELPAGTVYILADGLEAALPRDGETKALAPGFHSQKELDCGSKKRLLLLPGVHRVEGDKLFMKSGKDLIIPRGATLKANIAGTDVENAGVYGHGVIDATDCERLPGENWRSLGEEGCVFFLRGKNIVIDGPLLYNPQFWATVIAGTEAMRIRNFKVLAWIVNDDGLQPRSVNDFAAENCFLKCMDDCVAIKTRKAIGMESRKLRFEKLVLWKATSQGLEIGHTSQADILEDVLFKDVEIVGARRSFTALSIHVMDHETVRNVRYENIHVEGERGCGCGFNFEICGKPSPYRTDPETGHVEGVVVKNMHLEGEPDCFRALGHDATHMIKDVKIAGLFFHGANGERREAKSVAEIKLETRFAEKVEIES